MKLFRKVQYNSPVVLDFALLALLALVLGKATGGWLTAKLFCVYRSPLTDLLTYPRFFLHVLGHSGWAHYSGNILMILVIGPQLEERYGSRDLLISMAVTAFVTGLVQWLFFPGTALMGASGIVFMMILMASMGGGRSGGVPLTLILPTVFGLGTDGVFMAEPISNVIGGTACFVTMLCTVLPELSRMEEDKESA